MYSRSTVEKNRKESIVSEMEMKIKDRRESMEVLSTKPEHFK